MDKPGGWTSHDVVNKARRLVGTRKVGHLGTLDPMATGVLPLLIGRATRLAQFFGKADKVYRGHDCSSVTQRIPMMRRASLLPIRSLWYYDRIRIIESTARAIPGPNSADAASGVRQEGSGHTGVQTARRNIEVKLNPVEVEIHSIDMLRCEDAEIDVRVHCGVRYVFAQHCA